MKNLDYFIDLWDLEKPELITETKWALLYKTTYNHKPTVLKIFGPDSFEDEKDGIEFLNILNGQACVKAIEYNENGLLMEYLDGPTLDTLVIDGQDDEASEIIAKILNQIHAIPIPKELNFRTLETRFESLFEYAQKHQDSVFEHAARLAKKLLKNQTDICLLHGDMHHSNVMKGPDGGWIAIDPKGLVGDPAYDAANTFRNPHTAPDIVESEDRFLKQTKIVSDIMDIDHQKIINYAFVQSCLSISWSLKDDEKYKGDDPMIEIIQPFAEKI